VRRVLRESHDRAWLWASIQVQQLGAMVALLTDEHQSFLFDSRDVAVTEAKLDGYVNYHGALSSAIQMPNDLQRAARIPRRFSVNLNDLTHTCRR
jgi:hypothetical protein